ncbi:MAG: DUF222 domain-containing protein, partial [Actinomycetes bacterium]
MSLTTLPPRVHPVLGALAVLGDGLDALAAGNLWSLSDAELLAARVELGRLSARLAAAALGATRELDVRGAAVAAGATSLTAWLVTVLGLHPGEAGREVALAAALGGDLPATA